jgi:hypothetical protein
MSSQANNGTSPWDECVPHFLHPIKVAIIEALLWIQEPLSARSIERLMDDGTNVALVSYHLRCMAEAGVVEQAEQVPVRGAIQTFYRFPSVGDSAS